MHILPVCTQDALAIELLGKHVEDDHIEVPSSQRRIPTKPADLHRALRFVLLAKRRRKRHDRHLHAAKWTGSVEYELRTQLRLRAPCKMSCLNRKIPRWLANQF